MVEALKKRKFKIKTYVPDARLGITTEHAMPLLSYIGLRLSRLGGFLGNFSSGILTSIRALFNVKAKVEDYRMRHSKIIVFKRRK